MHMTKKHTKKTLELGKHTLFGKGGVVVSPIHEKKIVSVGANSTFRHPLGDLNTFGNFFY
jgi:hypothetical protein